MLLNINSVLYDCSVTKRKTRKMKGEKKILNNDWMKYLSLFSIHANKITTFAFKI